MRRAYTFIIIGSLFTIWRFSIYNIDLLNSAVGYLLILLGITYVDKNRPIPELRQAKFITMLMCLLELVSPLLPYVPFVSFALSVMKMAIPVYLYFCLIKADYMWRPSSNTRNFLQRYRLIGFSYLILFLLVYVTPQLAIVFIVVTSLYFTYLLYVLLQLRQNSTN